MNFVLCFLKSMLKKKSLPVFKDCLLVSLRLFVFTAIFATVSTIAPEPSQASPSFSKWKKIADDLELTELEIDTDSILTPRIILVRSSLTRYRPAIIHASNYGWKSNNVKRLAEASKAVLVINGSFFDEHGKPLGLVISRGITHNRLHQGGKTLTGIFQVTRAGISINSRDGYEAKSVIEAIQAGPRLIANDYPISGIQNKLAISRRSGVCLDSKGRLLLFCVSSGLSGISLPDLQRVLMKINCKDALNFDGGGSSQLYLSPRLPGAALDLEELFLPGRDDIPIGLGLFVNQ